MQLDHYNQQNSPTGRCLRKHCETYPFSRLTTKQPVIVKQIVTMSLQEQHKVLVQTMYRQSLRLTKSWINRRDLWREKACEIRRQFDRNKDLTDKYQIDYLVKRTSELLAKYKHPDPIIPPQRPDGTKFERNIPTSPLLYKYREGDHTL